MEDIFSFAGHHQHLQAAAGGQEQVTRGTRDTLIHHLRSSQYLDSFTSSVPDNI
jgi:hypothetical protein